VRFENICKMGSILAGAVPIYAEILVGNCTPETSKGNVIVSLISDSEEII
jgi:hypothetical protein